VPLYTDPRLTTDIIIGYQLRTHHQQCKKLKSKKFQKAGRGIEENVTAGGKVVGHLVNRNSLQLWRWTFIKTVVIVLLNYLEILRYEVRAQGRLQPSLTFTKGIGIIGLLG